MELVKRIKSGNLDLIVNDCYAYRYDYGKGKEVLRLEIDEKETSFESLHFLKSNELEYFENNNLKNTYEGYTADFSCSYKNGIYSVELTRMGKTELEMLELKKRAETAENAIIELTMLMGGIENV